MLYRIKEVKHEDFSWFYPQCKYKFIPIWFIFYDAYFPFGEIRYLNFSIAKEYLNEHIEKGRKPDIIYHKFLMVE